MKVKEVQNNIYQKSPCNNPNLTLLKWLMTISLFIQTAIPAPMLLTGPDKKIKIAHFTLKFTFSSHRDRQKQTSIY